MLTLFRPRLRSWEDRVAVQTDSSLAFSSGDRPGIPDGWAAARPAASREPYASSRWRSSVLGRAPKSANGVVPSATRVTSRPVVEQRR